MIADKRRLLHILEHQCPTGTRHENTPQPLTKDFIKSIDTFLQPEGIELVRFKKGQRKDEGMKKRLARFQPQEGVVFVGVAQEKVRVPRTTRKALEGGGTIPWIIYSTAMVNV